MEKAQRPEEFMGRSTHIAKGGNKMKGQKELKSINLLNPFHKIRLKGVAN